jgi:hypothetical protein
MAGARVPSVLSLRLSPKQFCEGSTLSEYDSLLSEVRAKADAFRSSAREYIPKMYAALGTENQSISPLDARDRIEKDCVGIWSKRTILDALPDEAKNPEKQESGRLGQKKRKSAAVSAAPLPQQESQEQVMIDTNGVEVGGPEVHPSNPELSPDIKSRTGLDSVYSSAEVLESTRSVGSPDPISSEPIQEIELLKKRLVHLQKQHSEDLDTISDLKDVLAAATSFTPAGQIPRVQSGPSSFSTTSEKQDELEFEFSVPFEELRMRMADIFNQNKGFGAVLIHGIINVRTGKVTHVYFGSNASKV